MSNQTAKTLKKYNNIKEFLLGEFDNQQRADIAKHGCMAGWTHLTYNVDILAIHAEFGEEIEAQLCDEAEMSLAEGFFVYCKRNHQTGTVDEFITWQVYAFVESFCAMNSDVSFDPLNS